jgi:hypothetical protein
VPDRPSHLIYKIFVVPSGPAITNFGYLLQGFREVDGSPVSIVGTFDRDENQPGTYSPSIQCGKLFPGYSLSVTERTNVTRLSVQEGAR